MANPSEFFAQMMPYAQQVSQRTGLDPRLVLAQAALETGYGRSAPNNNFFGIKSHGRSGGSTLQTQEFEGGRMVSVPQSFRGYESPEQSFMDYANFITSNPRYRPVLEAKDLEGQIRAMGASGYATDPDYAAKLANIAGMVDPSARVSTPTQGGRQMAIMEQRPQGLLSALGIQRRDPTAQGETALPFYQRESFGNTLDDLMLAFNSMTLRPDPNLAQQIGQRRQERTSAKQRNATAAWLRSQGREDLASAMETGSIKPADAVAMSYQRPEDPRTALQKNYEFFIAQGMSPEQAMQAVRSGTTINMPGTPTIGTIPPGYQAIQDPQTGSYRLEVLPGGPAQAEVSATQRAKESQAATASDSIRLIDSVLNAPGLGSVTGMVQGRLPALTQAGTDLVTKIEQLQGQAFLQAFESLKGGGAITEREGLAAQNAIARLNRAQSEDAFKEALIELRDIVDRGRRRAAGEQVPEAGGISVGEPY